MRDTSDELFERCREVATATPDRHVNLIMHETLVLCCSEGLRGTGQGYGSLFSQVDYLCKQCRLSAADRAAVQVMRRHSNSPEPLSHEELLYDVRALCLLVAAVFHTTVPDYLLRLIPHTNRPSASRHHIDRRYIRCIATTVDTPAQGSAFIYADSDHGPLTIDISSTELDYLRSLVRPGTQLNLLDSEILGEQTLKPALVIVEPDFLLDISTVAAGFVERGLHPLAYTSNRLRPRANSQAILLGNFASTALDELVSNPQQPVATSIRHSFREQVLQFCACREFDAAQFVQDARLQAENLRQVVDQLFAPSLPHASGRLCTYARDKVVVEPSFVCERLGLQGRVDLMTTDLRLLVEQKSGRNLRLERHAAIAHREDHYVQLLLYFGILHYNFGVSNDHSDIRLLYSKYPPQAGGLLVVNFYRQLFNEALKWRNMVVSWEYYMARQGVQPVLPLLKDNMLNSLSPLERAYLSEMMTFVYREQLRSRTGTQEGQGSSVSDLWNMPLGEKLQTGNIYTGLKLTRRERSAGSAYDLLTFNIPPQDDVCQSRNFRTGDVVYLYAYDGQPDITRSILFKGTLEVISFNQLTVRLTNGQQNADTFRLDTTYALEHGSGDVATTSNLRSLYQFAAAAPRRRQLLLGQRPPESAPPLHASTGAAAGPQDANLRSILHAARQARDYYLLQGPPGTGKTSMALRYLVADEVARGGHVLLTAYTNRAVDEICLMLEQSGQPYLRLANRSSCAPDCRNHLLDSLLDDHPQLETVRQRIIQTAVVVATISMLQSRPFILEVKSFSLVIVDEASQILEPSLVGLLSSDAISRFILVGDHKQLPAVVGQPEEETRVSNPQLRAIGVHDCRHSLFERLLRWERMQGRRQFVGTLHHQGRMHPDVADFACRMFYRREQLTTVPLPHQLDESIGYPVAPCTTLEEQLCIHRTLFIDSSTLPEAPSSITVDNDKANTGEAQLVAFLLCRLHHLFGPAFDMRRSVGVIVPYRIQIDLIRRCLQQTAIPQLADITIDTVERYQGSQRDVIVYSTTVTQPSQLAFLTASCFEEADGEYASPVVEPPLAAGEPPLAAGGPPPTVHVIDRKLNVAITRARKQLIVTGNKPLLRQNSLYSQLIDSFHQLDSSHCYTS